MKTLIFDMDSTLIDFESLDLVLETAIDQAGRSSEAAEIAAEISRLTDQGMNGQSLLSETIPARINAVTSRGIAVTEAHFDAVAQIARGRLVPGLVAVLQEFCAGADCQIAVVSGGPLQVAQAVADELGQQLGVEVAAYANTIVVGAEGYDAAKSVITNAKTDIVPQINPDPAQVVMIGDGATDLAVYQAGQAGVFVGAGWVVERTVVMEAEGVVGCRRVGELGEVLHEVFG